MTAPDMIVKRPEEYAGEPRCFICSMSPDRVFFPNCATRLPDGTSFTHEETCSRYGAQRDRAFPADWLCPRCEREEAAWQAEHGSGA